MNFVFFESSHLTWKGKGLDFTKLKNEVKDCHASFDRSGNPIAPTSSDDEITTNIHTTISGQLHQLKITTRSTSNGFGWKYEFFPASVTIDLVSSSAKSSSEDMCRFGPCCTSKNCTKEHEFPSGKRGKYCVFALQRKCTKDKCSFRHPDEDGLVYVEETRRWCRPKKSSGDDVKASDDELDADGSGNWD